MTEKELFIPNIDRKEFENLISLGLTTEEIADFYMTNYGLILRWVRYEYKTTHPQAHIKRLQAKAKVIFLTEQRKLARGETKGNVVASNWIGKNYFGQSDPDKAIFRKEEPNVDVEERPDVFNEIAKRLKGGK